MRNPRNDHYEDQTVETVLSRFVQEMDDFLGAGRTVTMLFDERSQTLQPGPGTEQLGPEIRAALVDLPLGVGCAGQAALHRQPVVVEDIYQTELWTPFVLAENVSVRACWSGPILLDDKLLGTYTVMSTTCGRPQEREQRLAHVLAGHATNLLQQSELRRTFERLAFYDPLTQLPNREKFHNCFGYRIADLPEGSKLALLVLDIDRFKWVNETYGQTSGDMVLQEIGQRLREVTQPNECVARLGSDEFLLLLQGGEDLPRVKQRAWKLLEVVQQPLLVNGKERTLTASIGVAIYPEDGEDKDTLLRHANSALYASKENGYASVHVYQQQLEGRMEERLERENDLTRAIEQGELQLWYQPQVNVMTGQVNGVEALVRWPHPQLGMISPGDFIPLAEETGLIVPLGDWVLREACQQNKRWQEMGYPPLRVAVNLSARQFQKSNVVQTVKQVLAETGLAAHHLELEITETTAMQDSEHLDADLEELAKLGVQISLDDFGTGYSSLSRLKNYPVNKLKIDRSFVRDVTVDADNAAIVSAIIAMAHNLKLDVIAEGVETFEQMDFLRQANCVEIQGFLFSRPLPVGEVEHLFNRM